MLANKMAVNVSKCKFILFHNQGKKFDTQNLKIHFNSNKIGQINSLEKIIPLERIHDKNEKLENRTYKYLGILLDENLNFNHHIDYLCKKLSKGLFCLNRAKNILP